MLTWIGIAVMLAVLVYWVVWENRRLTRWTHHNRSSAVAPTFETRERGT